MKRNKIMALTALLTLIGAPLSKAQETKGGSQQSTSAQSANKDSEAVDKTKEQNKNLDKTKDSKAPQQAKDSKTPQQKKEQTKDSNKNGKKDEKKQQTKDSNPSGAKSFVNRMMSLGYSMEWIRKNWPWLAAISGTNLMTGSVSNKMGKKANVDAKVQQIVNDNYMNKADVAANYVLKTNQEGIKTEAARLGIKYTDVDLVNVVSDKVSKGELFTKDDVQHNYTKNGDVEAKAQELAGYKKYTDEELNKKVDERTKELQDNIAKIKGKFKYTEGMHKEGIVNALNQACKIGTIREMYNENSKEKFEKKVSNLKLKKKNKEKNQEFVESLNLIRIRLNQDFADIIVKTTYGDYNDDKNKTPINVDKLVDAFVMLSDIKNALVNGVIGDNFNVNITNKCIKFEINSKSYMVSWGDITKNESFYVENDDSGNDYLIPLKDKEEEKKEDKKGNIIIIEGK